MTGIAKLVDKVAQSRHGSVCWGCRKMLLLVVVLSILQRHATPDWQFKYDVGESSSDAKLSVTDGRIVGGSICRFRRHKAPGIRPSGKKILILQQFKDIGRVSGSAGQGRTDIDRSGTVTIRYRTLDQWVSALTAAIFNGEYIVKPCQPRSQGNKERRLLC
jgi:hypothetical protein